MSEREAGWPLVPAGGGPSAVTPPAPVRPRWWVRWARALGGALEWVFGVVTLVVGLAVLSVIPLAGFLSLGYLLEVSGRVARTGTLRAAFVGVRKAAVLGRMVLGTWLVLWPVRVLSGLWQDAALIAPGSARAAGWRTALVLGALLTLGHILWACIRGGKLRHFLWPAPVRLVRWLRAGNLFEPLRNTVLDYLAGLRLGYYFRLGSLGFLGALAWLLVPVSLLIFAAHLSPGAGALFSLVGGALLAGVTLYLPFLQAHFAATGQPRALFGLAAVRERFTRAPLAFWLALFITLLFALPLYLLKIEFPPREIAWLPSLFFVGFIFPARALTGWALARAERRDQPRHRGWQWLARLGALPVVFAYVLLVYLTQYFSWHGAFGLLEQHAFLVPAPMIGR